MRKNRIAWTVAVALLASCGGYVDEERSFVLSQPVRDPTGPGFTDSGAHYDSCDDYCARQSDLLTLHSCMGPTMLDASGEPADGGVAADGGAAAEGTFVLCSAKWQSNGCDAPYSDW